MGRTIHDALETMETVLLSLSYQCEGQRTPIGGGQLMYPQRRG